MVSLFLLPRLVCTVPLVVQDKSRDFVRMFRESRVLLTKGFSDPLQRTRGHHRVYTLWVSFPFTSFGPVNQDRCTVRIGPLLRDIESDPNCMEGLGFLKGVWWIKETGDPYCKKESRVFYPPPFLFNFVYLFISLCSQIIGELSFLLLLVDPCTCTDSCLRSGNLFHRQRYLVSGTYYVSSSLLGTILTVI